MVPITVLPHLHDQVARLEPNFAVQVRGRVTGLLRKVPGNDSGMIPSLELGLTLEDIRRTALVAAHMRETIAAPRGTRAQAVDDDPVEAEAQPTPSSEGEPDAAIA